MSSKTHCDLCGLRLPGNSITAEWKGARYFFCCAGCRHVFLLLGESGLIEGDFKESDLYKQCQSLGIIGNPDRAADEAPDVSAEALKGARELVLHVEGMWCSACSWLIEKVVGSKKGVLNARIVFASDTARVHYLPREISPAEIARTIDDLGYRTVSRDRIQSSAQRERNRLLIRTGIAFFLLMNVMFFSYTLYIGYFQELAPQIRAGVPWILLALSLPAVFWCGTPIHYKGWISIRAMVPTMETLLSLSIFSSFFYSVYALVDGRDYFYFDTATALVTLLLVGKLIEVSAKQKTSESIHRLYGMLPKKVRLKTGDGERMVAVESLREGDAFIVRPGEKIPADGRVVAGRTTVDESLLTGESMPRRKGAGEEVIGSSMNLSGVIEVEALRVGGETLLSGIIRMVESALARKSPLERTVDRVARFFVPAVLLLSLAVFSFLLARGAGLEASLIRGVTVLVIACPCALGMATPLAVAAGIGFAARQGILVRDGIALQAAEKTDTLVFDKTGTLTEGRFDVLDLIPAEGHDPEVLGLLASVERHVNHPIGDTIARAWGERTAEAADVRIEAGGGVEGRVGESRVCLGTASFVAENGFSLPDRLLEESREQSAQGRTAVFFGVEGVEEMGCLILGDALKPTAREAVSGLRKMGISVFLLSGDSWATTAAVAGQAGIDDFFAEALPKEKIEKIRSLQREGHRVAMIGDGINDAPALAQADVGMAVGGGTEIAMESSDITLLRDDLTLVGEAIDTSKRTVRAIKQNLGWAFLYNAVGIVLAVSGCLDPLIAAGAMLVSSLSVVANSLRLKEGKGQVKKKLIEFFLPWLDEG